MAKKHEIYWYRESPAVAKAFLYHCRDRDLRPGNGISRGSIIQGIGGFAAAESDVPGLTGSIVSTFRANRRCEWMGFNLPCMAHPEIPSDLLSKKDLRSYNNIVAALTEPAALRKANTLGVPAITHSDGTRLINLEVSEFPAQGRNNPRKAKLLAHEEPIRPTSKKGGHSHHLEKNLSPSCIYTIRHSQALANDYASGGCGEFTERSPWTKGRLILQEAHQNQECVPILFAPAEADIIGGLVYWAIIENIEPTANGTRVKFSSLLPLQKKHPLSSLIKISNGKPLSTNYIRPYVPCQTPEFLFTAAADTPPAVPLPEIDLDEVSGREGAISLRKHLYRERNRSVIDAKRKLILSETGRLECCVCTFDFKDEYGALGAEFCEVHHLSPLSDATDEIETRLEDLVIVCSNCHRMLHRSNPILTPKELKSRRSKSIP